ncbi:patatin-like phospholipase [Legionella quinlivanii]|uniref:Patatin-like phospholipase n=1 Tax=Legionella quinlivanii TaxID=45073 RepID=A0A0W0XKY8_9GAMM|nr:patatin-like phospholipase family protein [Legionella quinlivanii]KTD45287.1 patatin-like phospholipase [Legionella quinlivanii]SEG02765.1 NTE family protein [Legionella quinlivanii DSM 21216]STY11413.1 patatin-like phospholipase [Legionella quinlivanii]
MEIGSSCSLSSFDNVVNRRIVLVLQGGGALGAFQAGVYETLEKNNYIPNWIGGTSIGAINASIIAGNYPENRLKKLQQFWQTVTQPDIFQFSDDMSEGLRRFFMQIQFQMLILSGIPVFFKPQINNFLSWMQGSFNSFYDTSPLREFLKELIDFDYLNRQEIRLSLGATNLHTGQIRYFDSRFEKIGPEHVMASGALPPAFPPILIDNEYYWDGGIYSNTPLSIVLDDFPRVNSLCFMVDLWSPEGALPGTLDEVRKRNLEIIYSSRYEEHRKNYEAMHNMRRAIRALYSQLPPEKQQDPENLRLVSLGCITSMDIVQIQYEQKPWESSTKDADFSASSIKSRWEQGKLKTQMLLDKKTFAEPHPPHVGVVIHR